LSTNHSGLQGRPTSVVPRTLTRNDTLCLSPATPYSGEYLRILSLSIIVYANMIYLYDKFWCRHLTCIKYRRVEPFSMEKKCQCIRNIFLCFFMDLRARGVLLLIELTFFLMTGRLAQQTRTCIICHWRYCDFAYIFWLDIQSLVFVWRVFLFQCIVVN
jgi:hypothetical protein